MTNTTPRLRWAVLATAVAAVVTGTPAGATAGVHLTWMSPVSGMLSMPAACAAKGANSPQLAFNPADPRQASVVYSIGNGDVPVVARTIDGGHTWRRTALGGMTLCLGGPNGKVFDPFVNVTPNGATTVTEGFVRWGSKPGADHQSVRLYVANAASPSAQFTAPVDVDPDQADQRAPMTSDAGDVLLVAERARYVNPLPGYLFGVGGSIALARSTDGGRSFTTPTTIMTTLPGKELVTIGLQRSGARLVLIAAVVEDRNLPRLFTGPNVPMRLVALTSDDHGQSWGAPSTVGTYFFPSSPPDPSAPPSTNGGFPAGGSIPDTAIGPDGAVYVTWPNVVDHTIVVASSRDGARTWTREQAVRDVPAAMQPTVAVRPDGTVGVGFYRLSTATATDHTLARFEIAVHRPGTSWLTTPLTAPFDGSAVTTGSYDGSALGPYQDLAAQGDGFAAVVTLGGSYAPPGDLEVWLLHISTDG